MKRTPAIWLCVLVLHVSCSRGVPAQEAAPRAVSTTRITAVTTPAALVEREGRRWQRVRAVVRHDGVAIPATIAVADGAPIRCELQPGDNRIELLAPAVQTETVVDLRVEAEARETARRDVKLAPVRPYVIYLLPHSHVDIGYTKLQTRVEQDQWLFLERAIETARRTASFPPGARFKWNAEVLWAVDSYLRRSSPEKQAEFIAAVKNGWIGLDALYGSELTALCRPEELLRLVDCAVRLRDRWDVPISSAMITDVPGCTWGLVPTLSLAGVKYLSVGPNSRHRIGSLRAAADNRPFHWVSPCGQHRLLYWQTNNAYHPMFENETQLEQFTEQLAEHSAEYPYDIVYFRYCRGDNAGPDESVCEMVKNWNSRHVHPRLRIATTGELFGDFERRYGAQLPERRGDLTPYWEDGAATSARETAVNRAAAERLVQAETLWALLRPAQYPLDEFDAAWRNVILYDEHTWGGQSYPLTGRYPPGSAGYQAQWAIKRAFAVDAAEQADKLLKDALAARGDPTRRVAAIDVWNTCSWPRADLVVLPRDWVASDTRVHDERGAALVSQRLKSGELAFLARDVPPLGARRFLLRAGSAPAGGAATAATPGTLNNGLISLTIDPRTGAVSSLKSQRSGAEFVNSREDMGLNDYYYVPGIQPETAVRNGQVRIAVEESGPLLASLSVTSEAPGCHQLVRRLEVIDGLERVDFVNQVDKREIPLADLISKNPTKESFHFGFAFHVPEGRIHLDTPWAVVRPELDQLPGSCKNWFTVQRWVDVSNAVCGVTWTPLDAPLVEIGRIAPQPATAEATAGWIERVPPSQTLYSCVMHNYWTTNYQHDQPGEKTFRYSLHLHGPYDALRAAKTGLERSQPLLAVPVDPAQTVPQPFCALEPPDVILTALKPSRDRDGIILRLFGAAGRAVRVSVRWPSVASRGLWFSDLSESRLAEAANPIDVPAWGIVTLRQE